MKKKVLMGLLLSAGIMVIGCATPRYISEGAVSGEKVKFLVQENGGKAELVECNADAQGNLNNCRIKPVKF